MLGLEKHTHISSQKNTRTEKTFCNGGKSAKIYACKTRFYTIINKSFQHCTG